MTDEQRRKYETDYLSLQNFWKVGEFIRSGLKDLKNRSLLLID
jgi:hypothetical protein